jgi:hypothetical protein
MLKKILLVWLSILILSGVCFAQEDPAKEQMKDTTPAAAQEQPAMEDTASAVAQEPPALVLEEIQFYTAVEDRQPLVLEMYSLRIWTNYTVLPKLAVLTVRLMLLMFGILGIKKSQELSCL